MRSRSSKGLGGRLSSAARSVAADECPDSLTQQGSGDVAGLPHAEDAHGQAVVAAQGEGGGVDHLETVSQGALVGELVQAPGIGVLAGDRRW